MQTTERKRFGYLTKPSTNPQKCVKRKELQLKIK